MFGATSNFHYNTYSTALQNTFFLQFASPTTCQADATRSIKESLNVWIFFQLQPKFTWFLFWSFTWCLTESFTFTWRIFHFHFHLQNLWQVAMVPYRMERGQLVAIAPPSCSARYSSNSFILFKTHLENNLILNRIYRIFQASELIITFSDLTGWIWDNMPWQSFFFFWARCASFLKCPPFVNMIVLRWYSADSSQQCTAGFERTKVLWSEWKFFDLCWV